MFEEIFRARIGFDRVQDDADALGQLIEKRLVGGIEAIERGKLHDRFDFSFEQDRQDHDVIGRDSPRPELTLRVIRGDIGQENARFSNAACPTMLSPSLKRVLPPSPLRPA